MYIRRIGNGVGGRYCELFADDIIVFYWV